MVPSRTGRFFHGRPVIEVISNEGYVRDSAAGRRVPTGPYNFHRTVPFPRSRFSPMHGATSTRPTPSAYYHRVRNGRGATPFEMTYVRSIRGWKVKIFLDRRYFFGGNRDYLSQVVCCLESGISSSSDGLVQLSYMSYKK